MHRANHRDHCFTYLFGEEPRIVTRTRRGDIMLHTEVAVPCFFIQQL